jgi:hypothetical protein
MRPSINVSLLALFAAHLPLVTFADVQLVEDRKKELCALLVTPAPDDAPFVLDHYGKWEFGKDRVPIRHLAQILPPDFVAKLESEGIGAQLLTSKEVVAVVDAEMNPILSFDLMRGSEPTALRIESLNGSDPTNQNIAFVKQGKKRKGLNAELFRYARTRLGALGKAAGFTALEGHRTSDYLVNLLYRRIGHLEPTTDFGRKLYRDLDAAFLASSKFPEPYRIRNLDHFSEALRVKSEDAAAFEKVVARTEAFLAGDPPDGWKTTLLGGKPGAPVAIGVTSPQGTTHGPFFLYSDLDGRTAPVAWARLYWCCTNELILRSAPF